MLLGATTFALLFYGSLVVAGIAALVSIAMREGRAHARSTNVPTATVRGKGEWRRLRVPLWLPPLVALGGCVSAYQLHTRAYDVWVVTDGDHEPDVETATYVGSSPRAVYTMAPGTAPPREYGSEDAWVLNLSTRTVRIESVQYGGIAFGAAEPKQIPPGTAYPVYRIDDIGPDHPPPHETEVTGIAATMGMSYRDWLTWDR